MAKVELYCAHCGKSCGVFEVEDKIPKTTHMACSIANCADVRKRIADRRAELRRLACGE